MQIDILLKIKNAEFIKGLREDNKLLFIITQMIYE